MAMTGSYRSWVDFFHWVPLRHGGIKGNPRDAGPWGGPVALIDGMEDWLRDGNIAYTLERDPDNHYVVRIAFRSQEDLMLWRTAWR